MATEPEPSPENVVSTAARATFAEPTLGIRVAVRSPAGSYRVRGLVEPRRGRFRVVLSGVHERGAPTAVIGLGGEGFEQTVSEGPLPGGGGDQRCWFNPHAPVGSFLGTASVEESVRLLGATLESLRGEIARTRVPTDRTFSVGLRASAAKPRDDFRDTRWRVWGDRRLFRRLNGPIQVRLDKTGSRVSNIRLRLRGYKAYSLSEADAGGRPVTISASLERSEKSLVLNPPNCQAIE